MSLRGRVFRGLQRFYRVVKRVSVVFRGFQRFQIFSEVVSETLSEADCVAPCTFSNFVFPDFP